MCLEAWFCHISSHIYANNTAWLGVYTRHIHIYWCAMIMSFWYICFQTLTEIAFRQLTPIFRIIKLSFFSSDLSSTFMLLYSSSLSGQYLKKFWIRISHWILQHKICVSHYPLVMFFTTEHDNGKGSILPYHLPKVIGSVFQWTLCSYEGTAFLVPLK